MTSHPQYTSVEESKFKFESKSPVHNDLQYNSIRSIQNKKMMDVKNKRVHMS